MAKFKQVKRPDYWAYQALNLEDIGSFKSDYNPEYEDNDYYVNTDSGQQTRIDEFIEFATSHCTVASTKGLPQRLENGRLGLKTFDYALFSGIRILNLNEKYKRELITRLYNITVGGKKVTLFLPRTGDTFELGIRW